MLPSVRRNFESPFAMLREFDRAVGRAIDETTNVGSDTFAVDVHEHDDTLILEAELPGYQRDQIAVNVEQGVLTIEANRAVKSDDKDADTSPNNVRRHVQERVTHVARRFSLPSTYDTSQVDATLTDGVLTLRLPKREEVKPRTIQVK